MPQNGPCLCKWLSCVAKASRSYVLVDSEGFPERPIDMLVAVVRINGFAVLYAYRYQGILKTAYRHVSGCCVY